MKKILLTLAALNLVSSLASADIKVGTYKGKTTEGQDCQLKVESHPYNSKRNILTLTFNNAEGVTTKDVLNTAPGKLSELYSEEFTVVQLKYDELGPDMRIQAKIIAKPSASGIAELSWSTQRISWGHGRETAVRCVNLTK